MERSGKYEKEGMVEQEQRRIFLVGRFSGALELAGRRGREIVLQPPWRVARSLDLNFFFSLFRLCLDGKKV